MFEKNYSEVLKIAKSYNSNLKNKTINEKFLTYCFLRLNHMDEVVENLDDDALFYKVVLYKRGLVAVASNHAERFHSKLKKVAKERNGFLYNISKLNEIMNQRLEKYVSGFQGDKQCNRIKNRLLAEQKKFNITPIEECNCDSNCHFELIIGKPLPCMHTISESTIISMKYRLLDKTKFIDCQIFSVVPSRFEGEVSFESPRRPNNLTNEENFDLAISEIDNLIIKRKQYLSFYNLSGFTEEAEKLF